jgi:choline-sulfatase
MIRRAQYKYVYCHIDPEQLFDLENDPDELNNLAVDPNYADLLGTFNKEALERWDSNAMTQDVLISQRRRRLIVKAMNKGKRVTWDHQPIFDSSEMYMRNHIDLDDLESRSRFPKVE